MIAFASVVAGINILAMAGAIPVKSSSYRKISKGLGHAAATLFVLPVLYALFGVRPERVALPSEGAASAAVGPSSVWLG